MCLCLGCGGVGGVGGSGYGVWTRVWRGGVVLFLCEMCVWIICVDGWSRYLCICVLCMANTCASEVHPVFNLLHIIADIANTDSFV